MYRTNFLFVQRIILSQFRGAELSFVLIRTHEILNFISYALSPPVIQSRQFSVVLKMKASHELDLSYPQVRK